MRTFDMCPYFVVMMDYVILSCKTDYFKVCFILFMCICEYAAPLRPKEGTRSHGAVVTGSCELPKLASGN